MEQKINPCSCGGDVKFIKRIHTFGTNECYEDWEFYCKKCGGSWEWAADNFCGREYYSKDDVIDIWNKIHPDKESEEQMDKEKQIQEYESKQLINKLSKMSPMVIATAYLYAINYTLYGEDVTEKWTTVVQNTSALEKAYRKGYYDALQRQAESEE